VIVGGKIVRSLREQLPKPRFLHPRISIIAEKLHFELWDSMCIPELMCPRIIEVYLVTTQDFHVRREPAGSWAYVRPTAPSSSSRLQKQEANSTVKGFSSNVGR
jgi:hypothetical protein